MIGVLANPAEHDVVREFFELFKTPWEFARPGRHYDVLLSAGDHAREATADLVVVYAGSKTRFDEEQRVEAFPSASGPRFLAFRTDRIPIYGSTAIFLQASGVLLKDELSQQCAGYVEKFEDRLEVRVGYDLFFEISTLLTYGQPIANAIIPTLELHIALLRELIAGCGIPLIEIPPVPDGFQFVACLTHDVDHPSIRQHKWDHTALGFIYRATLGSVAKLFRGNIPLSAVVKNWLAALKLPFVYAGLAKDFWREFADQYRELEGKFPSTFFVIPYKGRPGVAANGPAPSFRASGYGARDIADILSGLAADGHEVGLHGIDAWADSSKGRDEFQEIQHVAGATPAGVRMHWLYFDFSSPKKLDEAGALYDSTCGYNEAIGYRAGATQVYKPLATNQLLELPLHVMDTALFYPSRMELSPAQAAPLLKKIQENACRLGGVLTVNWHDRSLVPERLWDAPYRDLIAGMESRGAWFATAGQAVAWFRKRRGVTFETDAANPSNVRVSVPAGHAEKLPGLRLRTYNTDSESAIMSGAAAKFTDAPAREGPVAPVPTGAN
jgi:hypothetical protein